MAHWFPFGEMLPASPLEDEEDGEGAALDGDAELAGAWYELGAAYEDGGAGAYELGGGADELLCSVVDVLSGAYEVGLAVVEGVSLVLLLVVGAT
jgi:hypothetical protein